MKPSKEAVERAEKAITEWLDTNYRWTPKELAEAALTAAMEHGERVWGGCDCLTNLDEKASYGLIRLED